MNLIRAAIYARVSSEQQAAAHTIESQIAAPLSAHTPMAYRYRRSGSS
jgi:DNA invertase Pin-like site-specific DNA recombinase